MDRILFVCICGYLYIYKYRYIYCTLYNKYMNVCVCTFCSLQSNMFIFSVCCFWPATGIAVFVLIWRLYILPRQKHILPFFLSSTTHTTLSHVITICAKIVYCLGIFDLCCQNVYSSLCQYMGKWRREWFWVKRLKPKYEIKFTKMRYTEDIRKLNTSECLLSSVANVDTTCVLHAHAHANCTSHILCSVSHIVHPSKLVAVRFLLGNGT